MNRYRRFTQENCLFSRKQHIVTAGYSAMVQQKSTSLDLYGVKAMNLKFKNSKIAAGNGTNYFGTTIRVLSANTTYSLKAFADYKGGILYGEEKQIATTQIVISLTVGMAGLINGLKLANRSGWQKNLLICHI